MSYAARAARGTALLGSVVAVFGALSPWVTYVGTKTPGEVAPFALIDLVLAALVAAGLGYASLLASGERAPRTVIVRTGAASLLLVASLNGKPFAGWGGPGSDVVVVAPAIERTATGLAHGGGWVVLFAAVSIASLAAAGWDSRRAGFAAIGGVTIWAVVATAAVPAGGLESAAAYWIEPGTDPVYHRGLSLALGGGALAFFGGLGGVLTAPRSRRPRAESLILSGLALAALGALLPWGVERVSHWHWVGVPGWGSVFLLVLCPYAALLLAEGISNRLARVALVLGAGTLATLLAELDIVNAGRVAGDAALGGLLAPGRVFPVAYYLLAVGSGLLLYGGWTAARKSG